MVSPIKIFLCYAHEDEELLNKLKAHLKPLQRQGMIDIWHDRNISAGTEWQEEIEGHLNTAQIILLLVSSDFMNSDYCYSIEMQRAIDRHNRKEARVIPIILRPVHWQDILGNIEALPTNAKPVMSSSWHSSDDAFFDVAEGIRKAIAKFQALHEYAESSPTLPKKGLLTEKSTSTISRKDDTTILKERVLSQTKGISYYCVRCKTKRKMIDPEVVIMKNGKPAMRGQCTVCGTIINTIPNIK